MAVNAEIATCGATVHERVSACGPLGSDPAVYMHTNERARWDVEFDSTIHLQWLTCSMVTPGVYGGVHLSSPLGFHLNRFTTAVVTCVEVTEKLRGAWGADLQLCVWRPGGVHRLNTFVLWAG